MSEATEFVTFYGASDDLIEVEGALKGCDEYNGEKARFQVCGLIVTVEFGSTTNGCWSVTVGQVAEGSGGDARVVSLAPRVRDYGPDAGEVGYSMALTLEVPAGEPVRLLEPEASR